MVGFDMQWERRPVWHREDVMGKLCAELQEEKAVERASIRWGPEGLRGSHRLLLEARVMWPHEASAPELRPRLSPDSASAPDDAKPQIRCQARAAKPSRTSSGGQPLQGRAASGGKWRGAHKDERDGHEGEDKVHETEGV